MNARELLLSALEQRLATYVAGRQRCKEAFSEDAVHDLRVASRRLLALLTVLHAVNRQPRLQRLRRLFKNQLDSLDALRDTQVLLAEIAATIAVLPDLESLGRYLRKREKRLLKTAEHDIRALKNGTIAQLIDHIQSDLAGSLTDQELCTRLLSAVDESSAMIHRRIEQIDPAQPDTIHRVRIALKKFRYLVEILHPLVPGFPDAQLTAMQEHQTAMGKIQDAEVMLRTLADCANHDRSSTPEPVRQFFEQRRADVLAAYLARVGELRRLWRPAPDRPFPWAHT